ncbi:MAG: C4-dicarboxylate ABC transporter, partial [Gammaproteobacteria bacterium]|nr:C4-dicarboxylate ABC transporter [Gammaproteobacteria bacterium]
WFTTAAMANKDFFDGLSADEQQLIRDAADTAYAHTMEHISGLADEALEKILAASDEVTVTRLTEAQIDEFRARAGQVEAAYLDMTGENGAMLLEQFKADLEAVQ